MKEPNLRWLQAPILTAVAILLITLASGGTEFYFGLMMTVVIGGGVATFYFLFQGSRFFSISLADFLAVYACIYVFIVETNFLEASDEAGRYGFILPVATFIAGALLRRREIQEIISEEPRLDAVDLTRGLLWLPPLAAIGMLTFAVAMPAWGSETESLVLLALMALFSLIVFSSVPASAASCFGFSEIMRFVHEREEGGVGSANAGLGRRLDREKQGVEHRDQQQG
jgi:voltage-gated potassium channel